VGREPAALADFADPSSARVARAALAVATSFVGGGPRGGRRLRLEVEPAIKLKYVVGAGASALLSTVGDVATMPALTFVKARRRHG